MRGLLVMGGGLVAAINLDQQEAGGVIGLLHQVKPGNARLLHAVARILEAGFLKGVNEFRFDSRMHVNDKHGSSFAINNGETRVMGQFDVTADLCRHVAS